MFNAVFENLRTATNLTIQTQQDLFKKWIAFWEEERRDSSLSRASKTRENYRRSGPRRSQKR